MLSASSQRTLILRVSFGLSVLACLTGCGADSVSADSASAPFVPSVTAPLTSNSVAISTLGTEDLVGPCHFDLLLPDSTSAQAGVLVVYERGDSVQVFISPDVQATMQKLHYAMIWAHECDASSSHDLQADASKGPARVLTAALTEFSTQTTHPELNTVPIIPYGFSAAGVLSITLGEQLSTRVLTLISYAAGSAYTDLNYVSISKAGSTIPTLILANSLDNLAGDTLSLHFFQRMRPLGAPWALAIENGVGHCCNSATPPMLLPWVQAIVAASNTQTLPTLFPTTGALTSFTCVANSTTDGVGEPNCGIKTPQLLPISTPSFDPKFTSWVPDAATAAEWLAWVTN